MDICHEEILKSNEFFGQFGKTIKISVNRSNQYASAVAKHGPTGSAYVTFKKSEDALRCIKLVDGALWRGKPVKACFGTTKYCNAFIKGMTCNNPDCLYLHEEADEADCLTKEDVAAGLLPARFMAMGATNTFKPRLTINLIPNATTAAAQAAAAAAAAAGQSQSAIAAAAAAAAATGGLHRSSFDGSMSSSLSSSFSSSTAMHPSIEATSPHVSREGHHALPPPPPSHHHSHSQQQQANGPPRVLTIPMSAFRKTASQGSGGTLSAAQSLSSSSQLFSHQHSGTLQIQDEAVGSSLQQHGGVHSGQSYHQHSHNAIGEQQQTTPAMFGAAPPPPPGTRTLRPFTAQPPSPSDKMEWPSLAPAGSLDSSKSSSASPFALAGGQEKASAVVHDQISPHGKAAPSMAEQLAKAHSGVGAAVVGGNAAHDMRSSLSTSSMRQQQLSSTSSKKLLELSVPGKLKPIPKVISRPAAVAPIAQSSQFTTTRRDGDGGSGLLHPDTSTNGHAHDRNHQQEQQQVSMESPGVIPPVTLATQSMESLLLGQESQSMALPGSKGPPPGFAPGTAAGQQKKAPPPGFGSLPQQQAGMLSTASSEGLVPGSSGTMPHEQQVYSPLLSGVVPGSSGTMPSLSSALSNDHIGGGDGGKNNNSSGGGGGGGAYPRRQQSRFAFAQHGEDERQQRVAAATAAAAAALRGTGVVGGSISSASAVASPTQQHDPGAFFKSLFPGANINVAASVPPLVPTQNQMSSSSSVDGGAIPSVPPGLALLRQLQGGGQPVRQGGGPPGF